MNKMNKNKMIYSIFTDYELSESVDEIMERVDEIENVYSDINKRSKLRLKEYHDKDSNINKRLITDLIVENRYYFKNKLDQKELTMLWIENKSEDLIKDFNNILNYFPKHKILLRENAENLCDELESNEISTQNIKTNKTENVKIDNIDIIILDLYLSDDAEAKYQGEDILKYLKVNHIGIPIIILSISEDYEEVARLYSLGADFFINKKYALQIPLYIHRVFDKYGQILWLLLENSNYRKNLLNNIRYWMFYKDFLWYGDKCYHMIDHSFNHIYDNWINTNKLFMIIKDKREEVDKSSDSDLYSFCMAVWLHDIGHKGNERYGEAFQIRDTHGIISGELILQSPNLFNISEEEKFFPTKCDEYYKDFTFPLGNQKFSVIQLIRDRQTKETFLSNAEKIALFSIFHKSNAPLTREDGLKMQSKDKFIPSEYFENSDPNNGKLITLEDILEKRNKTNIRGFLEMTSLFRFIDGIDLHKTRVGDESEKELKLKVINQDREYYLKKLEETTNFLIEKVAKNNSPLALQIYNDLFINAKDKIERQEFKLDQNYKNFIQEKLGTLENYWMILNYASFISVQDGHFDLHNCVEEIDIDTNESKIAIIYHLNKGITWLLNSTVREMRVGKMTILEKIFGKIEEGKINQLPYPLDELKAGAVYLKKILKLEDGLIIKLSVPSDKIEEDKEICEKLNINCSPEDQTGTFLIFREFKIDGCKLTLVKNKKLK